VSPDIHITIQKPGVLLSIEGICLKLSVLSNNEYVVGISRIDIYDSYGVQPAPSHRITVLFKKSYLPFESRVNLIGILHFPVYTLHDNTVKKLKFIDHILGLS
jgi:hypothetical protein